VIVPVPAGTALNDVLLAQIIVYDGTGTNVPTIPTGWTLIRHDSISATNLISSWLYYKIAVASEVPSYTWTITSQYAAGVMGDWRNAAFPDPIDTSSGTGVGGSNPVTAAAPSLTPFTNGELQVYFYASQDVDLPVITEPAPPLTSDFNQGSMHESFTLAFGELAAPNAGTPSPLYSASSTAAMGFPVITAQAVLLVPVTAPSTPTATATPPPMVTATPSVTPTPTFTMVPVTQTPTATATPVSPISFVNHGALTDANVQLTIITVAKPSGAMMGDVLLAQIIVYDGTGTNMPSAPSGWNLIRHDAVSIGNKMTSWLYYKVAGASEPGSYSWTIAPQYAAGVMGAWRGASASPLDQSSGAVAGGGNPALVAAPSLTPVHNNELQVYFYGSQAAAAPTITEPGAINQHANLPSSLEGFTLAFGDLAAPFQAVASPTYTASSSSPSIPVITGQAVLLIAGP